MENNRIQDLEAQIQRLQSELSSLTQAYYKNNFSAFQQFNKSSEFTAGLKVPRYTTLPACEVGQLAEKDGKLLICSAANTWSIVGTQIA